MNILIIGPKYFNYPDSAAWALQQIGHETLQCNWIEFSADAPYWMRKLNKIGHRWLEKKHSTDWELRVVNICNNFNPDVCLIMNGDWISESLLERIKNRGCKMILWMIDGFARMPRVENNLPYFHKVFSFDHTDSILLQNKYHVDCEYCPVGYDPRYYFPKAEVHRDIDISFVGAPLTNRKIILQEVAKFADKHHLSFAAFGRYWDDRYFWKRNQFARQQPELYKYVHNKSVLPAEVADIYRRSKICLNIHIPVHQGLNPRTFEILGTQSFQITDRNPKLSELLTEGRHLVAYNDLQDLLAKVEYFLRSPKEREEIAAEGYRYAHERYSIIQSMQNILAGK